MDMMKGSTSFRALRDKYKDFSAPSVEITVGSEKLSEKKADIQEIEVELTSGFEASGCVFYVDGAYRVKDTAFDKKIADKLQIGESVKIKLGYISREEVFRGYISQVEYQHGTEEDDYRIRVECMDIKGLLMKTRRMEFFTQKSADAVVKAILGETPVSSYLAGKEIDSCKEEEVPLRSHMMTDYEVIVEQAEKQGYEFFIIQGKAYFRKRQKVTSALMTMGPAQGILNARFSMSAQPLVKKIEIRSIDPESGKQIKGEASLSGSFGKQSGKLLGNSRQVYYEAGVKDAAEAKARAQARMNRLVQEFGALECECVGIPELVPGRFVEVKHLSAQADKKYYITYVRHVLNEDGYRTYLRAGVSSL